MINPFYKGKLIKEIYPDWKKLPWACSYKDNQNLIPNPDSAVIKEIKKLGDHPLLIVVDQGKDFSTPIFFTDPNIREMLATALSSATGKTLSQAASVAL